MKFVIGIVCLICFILWVRHLFKKAEIGQNEKIKIERTPTASMTTFVERLTRWKRSVV